MTICFASFRIQFHKTCNILEVTSATLHRVTGLVVRFIFFFCLPTELPTDTVQLPAVKVVQLRKPEHSSLQKEANNNRACDTVSADMQHFVCLVQHGSSGNTVRVIKSRSKRSADNRIKGIMGNYTKYSSRGTYR